VWLTGLLSTPATHAARSSSSPAQVAPRLQPQGTMPGAPLHIFLPEGILNILEGRAEFFSPKTQL
jgi:hypothetical protein